MALLSKRHFGRLWRVCESNLISLSGCLLFNGFPLQYGDVIARCGLRRHGALRSPFHETRAFRCAMLWCRQTMGAKFRARMALRWRASRCARVQARYRAHDGRLISVSKRAAMAKMAVQ